MVDASDSDIASSVESESQFQYIIDIPEKNHKELCIYRVPPKLRQLNAKAYTPQLISIGPFHHGKPQFKVMETQKKRYYHEFLERIKSERSNFDEFKVNYIKRMLGDIRKCYEEKSNLGDDKFAEMIELDAVFIMEFFLRLTEKDQHKDDYVMSKPWLTEGICLDLILLENQLPIEVLKELYEFVPEDKEKAKECCTFLDLACKCRFFIPCLVCKCFCNDKKNPESQNECQHMDTKHVKHLTDLLRCFYIPEKLISVTPQNSSCILHSATKLRDSGISFKVVRERCLLHVNFNNRNYIFWLFSLLTGDKIAKARLELPQLIIDDGTECKLRNLIALEQCHYYPDYMFIYNYVSLIDGLIETKEDVNFLLGEKVIANYLGSNHAVEKLVNSLCRELVTGRNYYQEEINELNKHCGDLFNLTMGTLRSVYLKDLWRASSTIVGLAVLAFTFVNFFRATLK
ncbi:hypothetical protein O6P43_017322 [Quillaja saponaria]|uniref:Uncharacterized protein n=1 Tax=Quillaja saponaria TaxID=32244 RepID=A0AAD7LRA5_QUISA|nr:hypothetical protein O6P43_017322 [Quillaja saponaria]